MDYLKVVIGVFLTTNLLLLAFYGAKAIKNRTNWNIIKSQAVLGDSNDADLYRVAWTVAAVAKNQLMKKLYLVLGVLSVVNLIYIVTAIDTTGGNTWWVAVAIGVLVTIMAFYNYYCSIKRERIEKLILEGNRKDLGISGAVTINKLADIAIKNSQSIK